MQDLQLCDIAGIEQVWTRDGWEDRFGLDLAGNDHGYGHGPDDVGKVRAPADLLAGYYHAVHKVTLEYIASVTAEELSRVVDTHWTPPVTASARLVSIIDDCAQHLGQAAYVRGIVALTMRYIAGGRARFLWPAIAVTAMFVLGLGGREGVDPVRRLVPTVSPQPRALAAVLHRPAGAGDHAPVRHRRRPPSASAAVGDGDGGVAPCRYRACATAQAIVRA